MDVLLSTDVLTEVLQVQLARQLDAHIHSTAGTGRHVEYLSGPSRGPRGDSMTHRTRTDRIALSSEVWIEVSSMIAPAVLLL